MSEEFDARVASLGIVATEGIFGGQPRISGRRIPVSTLVVRFREGESMAAIAEDYDLSVTAVENAIRFACLPLRSRRRWAARKAMERPV